MTSATIPRAGDLVSCPACGRSTVHARLLALCDGCGRRVAVAARAERAPILSLARTVSFLSREDVPSAGAFALPAEA